MPPESCVERPVPSVSIDGHFANVPRLHEVRFDAVRCADLFMHPVIGIPEEALPRIHVYIRPDYQLAYTREERKALKAADPTEYDSESASCIPLDENGPMGEKGDVLMTIVYGTHYTPNKLLCHEGVHAREMLRRRHWLSMAGHTIVGIIPQWQKRLEALEEQEANRAMEDPALRGLRRGVIEIIKEKKSRRRYA